MKTAGRRIPNRRAHPPGNRAHGAEDRNRSRLISWAAKQGNFQPQGTFFLLTPTFIELTRSFGTSLDTSVQVGLFLGCVSCHSGAEVFFLLNFFVVEGGCEVFGLEDLADLYVAFAIGGVGASLDPLDGLFERLHLPEPEAGDDFLGLGEGAVNDSPVLAGEADNGAFGRGVKTVVAYQNSGFQELLVEFIHVGHELGIGGGAFVFFLGFGDDHESHFVYPFGLSRSDVQVQSLIAALPICRTRRCRIDMENREYSR